MNQHPHRLQRNQSVLVVIDLQTAYSGKFINEDHVIKATQQLLDASTILGIPVIVTEQYPKGLGTTREEIRSHLPDAHLLFEKTSFSIMGSPGLTEKLKELGRKQIVIAGIETQVCINQSVHDLIAADYQVHLVREAISSRLTLDDQLAYEKMLRGGALPATIESTLFEWLLDSKDPHFKAIQQLVL